MSSTQPFQCSDDDDRNSASSVSVLCRHINGDWPFDMRRAFTALATHWSALLRFFDHTTFLAWLVCVCVSAHAQVIQTIAGGVNPSHSPSENACVPLQSVAPHGTDVYFAGCAQIFKVNAQGQFTHVAGTGINAFSPDGTPAASANFDNIASLSLDSAGNIYFNEAFTNRVREIVASTGLIKTVAGTEVSGYSGDGGPATNAEISGGFGMGVFADANRTSSLRISAARACARSPLRRASSRRLRETVPGLSGDGGLSYVGESEEPTWCLWMALAISSSPMTKIYAPQGCRRNGHHYDGCGERNRGLRGRRRAGDQCGDTIQRRECGCRCPRKSFIADNLNNRIRSVLRQGIFRLSLEMA